MFGQAERIFLVPVLGSPRVVVEIFVIQQSGYQLGNVFFFWAPVIRAKVRRLSSWVDLLVKGKGGDLTIYLKCRQMGESLFITFGERRIETWVDSWRISTAQISSIQAIHIIGSWFLSGKLSSSSFPAKGCNIFPGQRWLASRIYNAFFLLVNTSDVHLANNDLKGRMNTTFAKQKYL